MTLLLSGGAQECDGAITGSTASTKFFQILFLGDRKCVLGGPFSKCQRAQGTLKNITWKFPHFLVTEGVGSPHLPSLDPELCAQTPAPPPMMRTGDFEAGVAAVNTQVKAIFQGVCSAMGMQERVGVRVQASRLTS